VRWLFLLLLAANLAYFGREYSRDIDQHVRNNSTALPVPASASRLSLIREMAKPPPERSTEDTISTVNRGAADGKPAPLASQLLRELPAIHPSGPDSRLSRSVCFTYGPLPEHSQATGLDDWFRSHGARTRIRSADGEGSRFFWIYLAPRDSRQGAMQVLQALQSQGVSGYRLIRRGHLENAVSLGVFSSQSEVNRRLGELQRKGYKPVVVPYTGVKTVYRVDVRFDSLAGDMNSIINGYPSRFNSVPVNCNKIDIADNGS